MDKIITCLHQLINEVPRQLQQFSPSEMSLRPTLSKWSKREILGHLCDSALHNWQRFNLAQQTSEPLQIVRYQQDVLVGQNNWQGQPTGQVVALWVSLNTQIVEVLKNLSAEKLSHPILLPDGTMASLLFLIQDYLDHLEHHLGQIFTGKIKAPTLPVRWQISTNEALEILENQTDEKILATLLEREKMYVEIYRPQKIDRQISHTQDEIYVVISGSGTFFNNGLRSPFAEGDLIFVPAGVEHRFENFTNDFATWVIFY